MSYTRVLASTTNAVLFTVFTATAWGGEPAPDPILVTEERALMGTQVIVKALDTDRKRLDRAVSAAFDEVWRLERLMSNFMPDTELSRINQQAGKAPVRVSQELFDLLKRSLEFSEITGGTFDISFASVGKLWNFRTGLLPEPADVKAQLPFVDYRKIQLDEKETSVFLPFRQMEIGLGGIGKGYAMDRAMAVLAAHGIHNAIVMAGGDTLIRGKKGEELWRIGLRDPDKKDGVLAVLPLEDQAISTSGDYERFFIKDGVRYHHILDPRTGYPARLCRSVTVLARDATTSDALTKGVFILGPQHGLELIKRLDGVEAIVVDDRGKMYLTPGLAGLGLDTETME
jgi:thiamine biosynthesis lipoprotein